MSWGDFETAGSLLHHRRSPSAATESEKQHHPIHDLLLRLRSHPFPDPRDPYWRDLLLHYGILAHLRSMPPLVLVEGGRDEDAFINWIVLCGHVARMSSECARMQSTVRPRVSSTSSTVIRMTKDDESHHDDVSLLRTIEGRGRAACGAARLCGIWAHDIASRGEDIVILSGGGMRKELEEMVRALVDLISVPDPLPQLFDMACESISLLIILLSPQLYRPIKSSLPNSDHNVILSLLMSYESDRAQSLILSLLSNFRTNKVAPIESNAHSLRFPPVSRFRLLFEKSEEPFVPSQHHNSTHKSVVRVGLNTALAILSLPLWMVSYAMSVFGGIIMLGGQRDRPHVLPITAVDNKEDHLSLMPRIFSLRSAHSLSEANGDEILDSVKNGGSSALVDLGLSFFFLLLHNYRQGQSNPYRDALANLKDLRWFDDEEEEEEAEEFLEEVDLNGPSFSTPTLLPPRRMDTAQSHISVSSTSDADFEKLFNSLCTAVQLESGILLLYTVLTSSKAFATYLSVRSDLDIILLPLLKTLYEKSTMHTPSKRDNTTVRTRSSLYVPPILLLMVSQDPSFGSDAFRRSIVSFVPWYVERQLCNISLGSLMILILLRSISHNLNCIRDKYLLDNCCGVLWNLVPEAHRGMHPYTAARLIDVMISCMKRCWKFQNEKDNLVETSVRDMFVETSRTLLHCVNICLRPNNIEKSLDLVYSLAHKQDDFKTFSECPYFTPEDLGILPSIVSDTNVLLSRSVHPDEIYTAERVKSVLVSGASSLRNSLKERNVDSNENFDFFEPCTYEEDGNPETFFIPYIWDLICNVMIWREIEWYRDRILVFKSDNNVGQVQQQESDIDVINVTGADNDNSAATKENIGCGQNEESSGLLENAV